MKNITILGIDTSTDNCSVALLKNNEIIAKRSEIAKSAHSEKLINFISEIFTETNTTIQDIDCIGVNIGPGSFTGLRIGLSTAKGLAFPNKIPILSVKSIPVMIENNDRAEDIYYLIKSHKNMVFYHHYKKSSTNVIDVNIEYGDIEELWNNNSEMKIVANFDFSEITGTSNKVIFPNGESVATLINKNYTELELTSDDNIEPYYLTSFQTQKWSGNKKK